MKWISLGSSCQPAYWIRNYIKQPEAYFFDWLITPPKALVKVLEEGIDSLLLSSNISIHHRGIRVVDDFYALEFQHDFPEDSKGIILPGYESKLESVREKYARRYQRMMDVINAENNTFLRYGDQLQAIEKLIPTLNGLLGVNNVYVFISHHITEFEERGNVYLFPCGLVDDWRGDNEAWLLLLDTMQKKLGNDE
ncbi:DUF1796 family putative cysteine peptidase [Alteromonas sp. 1_MG-2023]|uniref:DUF1796 family putative cysteine peptidase n=1 Tax=Alteromonas sp. 1_MG-2023 TaxID=3062669 RepID=UPI0026E448A3|nr:DUF1796 family putative cysteine peptidase [Alteromonas sp. 1_MG-2023]MDO6567910.1 DUF1796 family putative cysteine peptidase [Alteromonas sp. 1_MG-2023]